MIKRFHHVKENSENVNYRGYIYKRSLKYSARVYPEKIGKLFIDSMKVGVQYQNRGDRRTLLGAFRFAFGEVKRRNFSSRPIEIAVRPLPAGAPQNFTGLVGEHTFKASSLKKKYLVNEAIELRVEVYGPGALENFDDPIIYHDHELEVFDTKSEIVETSESTAKKILDYTYLPDLQKNYQKKQ